MSDPISILAKQLGYTGQNIGVAAAAANGSRLAGAANAITSRLPSLPEGFLRKTGIFAVILIAVIAILLIIHYTVRPIFKFSPDSRGVIPVPFGGPGGTSFWPTDSPRTTILDTDIKSPIKASTSDYSVAVNMIIAEVDTTNYVPLIVRSSDTAIKSPFSTDYGTGIGTPNLAITLVKGVNDLLVSTTVNTGATTPTTTVENIRVTNIPVRTPFVLGVVLGESYMEAYMNGRLVGTKKFNGAAAGNVGGIVAIEGTATAYISDLRLWPNAVSPAVMRALPVPTLADFGNPTFSSTPATGSGSGSCETPSA